MFNILFLSILNKKVEEIPAYIDAFLTLILGLVAAVLTLVGLLAIFISINSQHNIQKGRELLWDLKGEKSFNRIIKQVVLYRDIVMGNPKFTGSVIGKTTFTIIVVVIIVIILNVTLFPYFPKKIMYLTMLLSLIISIIFITFIVLLINLKNISKVSDLPTIKQLLNADRQKQGVDALALFAYSIESSVLKSDKDNKWSIVLSTPFSFEGIAIILNNGGKIQFYNTSEIPKKRGYSQILNGAVNDYILELNSKPQEYTGIRIRPFIEYESLIKELINLDLSIKNLSPRLQGLEDPYKDSLFQSYAEKIKIIKDDNGRFVDFTIQCIFNDNGKILKVDEHQRKVNHYTKYKSEIINLNDHCSSVYELTD